MVTIELDGRSLRVPEGTTILEAAQSANIPIPHLCYLKDINEIAACRMCMVEVEGTERLQPACNTRVTEGMVIRSNTPKVRPADQSAAHPLPAQLQLHRLRPQRQLRAPKALPRPEHPLPALPHPAGALPHPSGYPGGPGGQQVHQVHALRPGL